MSQEFLIQMDKKSVVAENRKELVHGTYVSCIDDRFLHSLNGSTPESLKSVLINEEQNLGPQIPGGSVGILTVLVETSPEGVQIDDFDKLYSRVSKAHERAGFKVGVHMDNDHGHLDDNQIVELVQNALETPESAKLPGCGYVAMLCMDSNPLELKSRTLEFFKRTNVVTMMVARGAGLAELEGYHANQKSGEAFAISNMRPGTTLNHKALEEKGLKIYGHDPLVADEIIQKLVEVLREEGEDVWAGSLARDGATIERKHHLIAARALSGMDPVEI